MIGLKPKRKIPSVANVEVERRVVTTTDITYRPMDTKLLKKYFPSLYEEYIDNKTIKRSKGSKE